MVAFVLPMVVYLAAGSLDPSPGQSGGRLLGLHIGYGAYPLLYAVKIGLTLLAMVAVRHSYGGFPFRVGRRAVLVGVVGVGVWVGLWMLASAETSPLHSGLMAAHKILARLGLGGFLALGARPALDPFQQFAGAPGRLAAFLAVRFLGLVVVVPVIEEFFLRGFLMRWIMADDWWNVPFGKMDAAAVAVSLIVPALLHPAEFLPAIAWFGMVTWLMATTRNLWDCVAAHAVTNLLLGIYVITTGTWALW
jgi:membrane protease YdiL (CAAX protease family)